MRTLHVLAYSELIWALVISVVALLFAYVPIYRNYSRAPSDRLYIAGEEYPLDMTGNLSYVQKGYNGQMKTVFNYSTRIQNDPVFIKTEYTLIGMFAKIIGMEPLAAFLYVRFLLSLGLFAVIYLIISHTVSLPLYRVLAYILVLFSGSLPQFVGGYDFSSAAVFDALVGVRTTIAMPHYLLGSIFSLLSLYFYARSIDLLRVRYLVYAVISGYIATLTYAPSMVLVMSGMWIFFVFAQRRERRAILYTGVYLLSLVVPVVYVRFIVSQAWVHIQTSRLELLNPFRLDGLQYIAAVGITFLLSFCSLPLVYRKHNTLLWLLWSWVIMHPVGEFFLSDLLHLNRIRYFLTPYYVAFGILSIYGLLQLTNWINALVRAIHPRTIVLASVVGMLIISIPHHKQVLDRANLCFCMGQFFDFGYPKKNLMHALYWLDTNTSDSDIVLSGYYAGTLIAPFSGNTVYVSWWYKLIHPPDIGIVEDEINRFYMGVMQEEEVRNFLKRESISYVLRSEHEAIVSPELVYLPYSILERVYDTDRVVLYKVKR